MRAFKYRLYPTEEQALSLESKLEMSRRLYNLLLEHSINAYKNSKKGILGYGLQHLALILRGENGLDIYSQSSQEVADRVTKAFKNFFRRVKEGKHGKAVGYPRFKAKGRYRSMTFPQYPHGFKILDDNLLSVHKVGIFKIKYLKDIDGKIKTLTIKKEATSKWYAIIICDGVKKEVEVKETEEGIGIDVGINTIIATSEGVKIENPHILAKSEVLLKTRHRQLSRKKKGSKNREKARIRLAKVYDRIKRQRETFLHAISNDLIKDFKFIVVEKLNIAGMVKNHALSRSINDASWGELVRQLTYKAEEAGRVVLQVDPKNTSKRCSRCGTIKEDLTLKDRVFRCGDCGLEMDRDVNAAKNIYTLGRREINACGDDASMVEKAVVSNVAEAGKQRIDDQSCRIRSY